VAARAIYYAAHHPSRREYYPAWSSVKAIFGNKIVPSLGDRYLARTGYDSQQYDGADDPNRPNNLWEPVSGDHGAHGRFDDRATYNSTELWLETHVNWLAAAAGVGVAGILWNWMRNGRESQSTMRKPVVPAA
jgi:hypothetical protein